MENVDTILEILEGQVSFTSVLTSYLGGTPVPESAHVATIRTGTPEKAHEIFTRLRAGMRSGQPCWLKLPASTFPNLAQTPDTTFFTRILALSKGKMEDEMGFARTVLNIVVNLAVLHETHS